MSFQDSDGEKSDQDLVVDVAEVSMRRMHLYHSLLIQRCIAHALIAKPGLWSAFQEYFSAFCER